MESLIEHTVEPELAAPAPRRTGLPLRVTLLLAVALLLLGVFAAGSGRALWEAAKLGWLVSAGRTTAGRIVEIKTEPAIAKGQPPRQVAARYVVDLPAALGTVHREGWVGLGASPETGPAVAAPPRTRTVRFTVGQSLPVRYGPWFGGVLSSPWQSGAWGRFLTLLLSGSLVLLVSLLLGRRLLRWTREHLHLLRQGTATVGTITHKRTEAEDMVRYFLRYGYACGEAEGREREEQVSMDQWKLFHVGQPVTVLYDPAQPERASLYALIRH